MPNNGTLHLPLKIVGLHDPDTMLEEPADPAPIETAEGDTATGAMSILPVMETSTVLETSTVVVTSSEAAQPSSTVGVDPPIVDEPQEPPQDDNDEGDDSGSSWWQDTWDWVKDKFDGLVDTVKGIGKESSS